MLDIHPSIKFAAIFFASFIATCLCFYLMLFLIASEMNAELELETVNYLNPAIAESEPEEPVAKRKRARKILPTDPPPDPDGMAANRPRRVELKADKPTFGSIADLLGPNDVHLELHAPVSDLSTLYVVQPIYPLSAAMKEIEGFVVVEFSVRENGTVQNPIVIDSEPPVLFDQAALNAVSRFKFKPREVGGDRLRVDNVKMKFAFNLESLYDTDEAHKQ
jgi:protein TonB